MPNPESSNSDASDVVDGVLEIGRIVASAGLRLGEVAIRQQAAVLSATAELLQRVAKTLEEFDPTDDAPSDPESSEGPS
ncbi:MAG: hypothetical protein AAGF12_12050 [Myxococcota bacterium]